MSTNYYFVPNPTNPLAIYGEIHIGKQSAGWVFSFQGYNVEGGVVRAEVDRLAGLSVQVEIPAFVVKSAEDWKSVLMSGYGTIKSEYNEEISYEDFWYERINKPNNSWHQRVHSKEYGNDSERNWVDAEGYSFSGYEFS